MFTDVDSSVDNSDRCQWKKIMESIKLMFLVFLAKRKYSQITHQNELVGFFKIFKVFYNEKSSCFTLDNFN